MEQVEKLKIGQKVEIHSYKHNGKIHRVWKYGYVVDIRKNCVVIVNNKTRVIESSGRVWHTKEPAVCFFFNNSWYNIISMLRSNGVHYYCNIASPYVWDGEAIKYVDYDLDLKVYPNGSMKVLDEKEYSMHHVSMNYSDKLDYILHNELDILKHRMQDPYAIYHKNHVYDYYEKYLEIKEEYNNDRY